MLKSFQVVKYSWINGTVAGKQKLQMNSLNTPINWKWIGRYETRNKCLITARCLHCQDNVSDEISESL